MLDDTAREEIRRVLMPFAGQIDSAAIFGSRATGCARVNSDIDLVLYGNLTQDQVDRLYSLFEDSNLPVSVDVVAYSPALYPPLKHHIDTFARPLLTRDDLISVHLARTA